MACIDNLTTLDMSYHEYAGDAAHYFRRAELAGTDAAYAEWARKFGRPLVVRAEEAAGLENDNEEEIASAYQEAEDAESNYGALKDRVEKALEKAESAEEDAGALSGLMDDLTSILADA